MRRRLAPWVLAAVALTGVAAGVRTHRVKPGESASSIAKRYYGNYESADLLLRYNGRTSTVIRAGETLRVPFPGVHRVRRGDSWSGIASKHLGRAGAYPALAMLNGTTARKPLQLDQKVLIPVVISHRLARDETLASLAERYYGDPADAEIIRLFNEIEDPRRLSVGRGIGVPVVSMRPRASGSPSSKPASSARAAAPRSSPTVSSTRRPPTRRRFAGELRAAADSFAAGEYDLARDRLESLRGAVIARGNDQDRRELWRLLTFVYVAFDLSRETCEAYGSLRAVDARAALDPDLVSPKIRRQVARCGRGG